MDSFERHLRAASGYLDLNMIEECSIELDQIDPKDALRPEVYELQVALYAQAEEWELMEDVARKTVAFRPDDPGTWVNWAFATRRAFSSIAAAREILLRAEKHHPDAGTIQFNLGCYACQTGDLSEARERVKRSIQIDKRFRALAMEDSDLEPLRKEIESISKVNSRANRFS